MVFKNQVGMLKIRLEVGNHIFNYLRVLGEIPESVPRRSLGIGIDFSRYLEKSRNLRLERSLRVVMGNAKSI